MDEEGNQLSDNYTSEDIAPSDRQSMLDDCRAFYAAHSTLMKQHGTDEQCGHDFWLTRDRHGAGFWDRGTGEIGELLTQAAHTYREQNIEVGDDGQLYLI
jgi:hypothetical protein